MKQIFSVYESTSEIKKASDLFLKIKKFKINYGRENLILICLNSNNDIVKSKVLFKGGLNESMCDVRVVFKEALLCDSISIIIAHNHPSNCLKPSSQDIAIKNRIVNAGDLLNISLLDFIIFSKDSFYSARRD